MCSHYQAVEDLKSLERSFGARFAGGTFKDDMWPKYQGVFVRRPPEHDAGDEAVPNVEATTGRWGLISALTKTPNSKLSTFNARSETAAKSFTFGNAWRRGQHCIIPADAIFEPDWRSGKAVPTRFTRADGKPLGVAGLWDKCRSPEGEIIDSYTMLTINADEHPLFKNYHQAGKEKRMVVILPEGSYDDWLTCGAERTREFLNPYPHDALFAEAVSRS